MKAILYFYGRLTGRLRESSLAATPSLFLIRAMPFLFDGAIGKNCNRTSSSGSVCRGTNA